MADREGVDLSVVVSGDQVELLDPRGTRVRAVVTRHVSSMSVDFAGVVYVFARYRRGRGWAMARGVKIVTLQPQLWES